MYFTKIEEMEFKPYGLEVVVESVICETENKSAELIVNEITFNLCLASIRDEIKCKSDELRELVKDKSFNFGIAPDFSVHVDLSSEEVLKSILTRIGNALVKSGWFWLRIEIARKDGMGSSKFSLIRERNTFPVGDGP